MHQQAQHQQHPHPHQLALRPTPSCNAITMLRRQRLAHQPRPAPRLLFSLGWMLQQSLKFARVEPPRMLQAGDSDSDVELVQTTTRSTFSQSTIKRERVSTDLADEQIPPGKRMSINAHNETRARSKPPPPFLKRDHKQQWTT